LPFQTPLDGLFMFLTFAGNFCSKTRTGKQSKFFPAKLQNFAGNRPPLPKCREAAGVLRAKAEAWAADLAPVVKELQAAGFESLRAIAAGLMSAAFLPLRGGKWSSTQVMRLLGAAGIPFGGSVAIVGAA
jgi:hypothetical protein